MPTTGGRRIDIVAQSSEGLELVVENQYGRADHDHLTRGLAYAVARHARGLIVVAEQHRGRTFDSATVVSDGGYRPNRVYNTSQNLRADALLLRCVVRWWAAW